MMKKPLTLLSLLILTSSLHSQDDIAENEAKAIAAEVNAMVGSFNKGDVKALLEKTHPAIYKLAGDQETFEQTLTQGAKQIMELGIKIDSLKVSEPTTLYKSGKDSVCFVPMSSVMHMGDQKIASTSFMIASKAEAGEWKYLDGSALKANPEMLWTFFPDLPKDIKLPPHTVQLAQDKEQDKTEQKKE